MEPAQDKCAAAAWNAYSQAVGGKSVNGEPLPDWPQLCSVRDQVALGWQAAAQAAIVQATVLRLIVFPDFAEAIQEAEEALRSSYDVLEWPGHDNCHQGKAMHKLRQLMERFHIPRLAPNQP